ncbi:MAG: hypothetical protein WCS98_02345 [Bacillota bacterium]|jgi:hypothetical protein|nr:hypothetical protein [Bacillota bacterium]MDD3297379.1 hypothetical protein [Bacillota bacterium]MDD3850637.1 hypothetical protein [Bacillota bacterium]MDD4707116.1 hypothetical protein [Bacillota bacterium]
MKDNRRNKYKEYGDYGRLPDNVFESYDTEEYPSTYRTTNALIFPLKLIDDEEVLSGEDFSSPDGFEG